MPFFENAVVRVLEDSTGFGALAGDRVYPLKLPRSVAYPAVKYETITAAVLVAQDGRLLEEEATVQVDVYGETYSDVVKVARQVHSDFIGVTQTTTGVALKACFLESEQDLFEEEFTDEGIYRRRMDFRFTWQDTGAFGSGFDDGFD